MTGEHVKRVVPVGALLVIVLAVLGGASGAGARAGSVLFSDNFNRANGPNSLITNEYADRNPGDSHAVRSKNWETTSGSFFVKHGGGWTGGPDGCRPDRYSKVCNDSSVFRLHTRRLDFGDVTVSLKLLNHAVELRPHGLGVGHDLGIATGVEDDPSVISFDGEHGHRDRNLLALGTPAPHA